MTEIAEKTLKQMYDEFLRTGATDWMSINSVVGKQLESLGFAALLLCRIFLIVFPLIF